MSKIKLLMDWLTIQKYQLESKKDSDVEKSKYLDIEINKINNIYNKLNNLKIKNEDLTKTIITKLGIGYFQRYQEFLITSIKGGY